MPFQTGLPAALRARGLTVELVPGWETRGSSSFTPKGALCHWTAGPRGSKTRPSLNICTNGRSDLPGPLCNVYLDRNGIAVVVAAGRANHAGAGNWKGLTGNSQLFGTEAEAAGADDFTPAQRASYPKVNAAFADLGKFGAGMVAGHSEFALPKGRKVDINGYTMDQMRAQVAAILVGEDDEMPLTQADYDNIAAAVVNRQVSGTRQLWQVLAALDSRDPVANPVAQSVVNRKVVGDKQVWQVLQEMHARQLGSEAAIKALSGALAAQNNSLTAADIEAAVRRAMSDTVNVQVSVDSPGAA